MTVSVASTEDVELLVRLRVDFFRQIEREISDDEKAGLEAALRAYYPDALARGSFAALVGMEEGRPVGAVYLSYGERPPNLTRSGAKTAYVSNVFTYPEYRGRGFARQLMEAARKTAEEAGAAELELLATEAGTPLYRKLGFAEPACLAMELLLEGKNRGEAL